MADSTEASAGGYLHGPEQLQGLESRLMEHGKLGPPIHLRVGCVGVWLDWCDLTGGGLSLGGHWPGAAVAMRVNGFWVVGVVDGVIPTTTTASDGAWNGCWILADGPGRGAHGNYGALRAVACRLVYVCLL